MAFAAGRAEMSGVVAPHFWGVRASLQAGSLTAANGDLFHAPPYPGAMQHAVFHGVVLRKTGTPVFSNKPAARNRGPGSAAHRFARATRCTASGTRTHVRADPHLHR